MIVCPNCNHPNPDGAVQCEACYTPLPATVSCPSCGATVQADASFCGQCGYNLRSAAAPTVAPDIPVEVPATVALDPLPQAEPVVVTAPISPPEGLPPTAVAVAPPATIPAPEAPAPDPMVVPPPTIVPAPPVSSPPTSPPEEAAAPVAEQPAPAPEPPPVVPEAIVAAPEAPAPAPAEAAPVAPEAPAPEEVAPVVVEAPTPPPEEATPVVVEAPAPAPEEAAPVAPEAPTPPPVAPARTQLQQVTACLIHVQSDQKIELPQNLSVIHMGKPNDRIPPDIDVSGFSNSEIVSRIHADIRVEGDAYYIEDVGSSNGTYINNLPLLPGNRHRLRVGDRIGLGKGDLVTFLFQIS